MEFVDKFISNIDLFAEQNRPVDLAAWFNYATFDIIGDLAFGVSFGCLDIGDLHFWVTLIFETARSGAYEQATRRFANPGSYLQGLLMRLISNKVKQYRKDHLQYSQDKVGR